MVKKKIIKSAVKPEWRLLYSEINPRVDKLYDIYRKDKQKAKVIYKQNTDNYTQIRVVLFEHSNGDFRIARISKKTGISINGIIYNRERTIEAITYKSKKFYYSTNKKIVQLTYSYLINFILSYTFGSNDNFRGDRLLRVKESESYLYLLGRFGWLRNLGEVVVGHHMSFNTITRHKLYNEKSIIRHLYSCSYPIGKMVSDSHNSWNSWNIKNDWGQIRRVCYNLDNLSSDMFSDALFIDTVRMADSLGYKINCSWSMKRFKVEHDKWMKEVVAIILEFEPLRELRLNKVFNDFAEFSGYELLSTNHALIAEGKRMNHCVGTYSSACDSGRSGIYRVAGYTLELILVTPYSHNDKALALQYGNKYVIKLGQIQGYSNTAKVPDELVLVVSDCILDFNKRGFEVSGDVKGNLVSLVDYNNEIDAIF